MTDWLAIALGELADRVVEVPGLGAHERIVAYHATTLLKATSDEVPWCSAFVCWVMETAGVVSTKSAMARSWLTWANAWALEASRFGAVTVLSRGEPGSNQAHVGFFCGRRPGRVLILGGNQGNAVSLAWFSDARVLGYRWPMISAGAE